MKQIFPPTPHRKATIKSCNRMLVTPYKKYYHKKAEKYKKLKYISVFLFGLVIWGCNSSSYNRIEVFYTPRDMTTPNPVSCIELETEFSNDFQNKVLDNETLFIEIMNHVKKLKKAEKIGVINARATVFIRGREKVDTLCIGGHFGVVLNGQIMEDDPELVELIWAEI